MNKKFWDMDASKQKREFDYLYYHSPYSDYFSMNFNINPTRSRLPLSPRKKKKRKHPKNAIALYNMDEQANDNNNEGYADEDNSKYYLNNNRFNKFFIRSNLNSNNNRHVVDDNDPIIKEIKLFLSPKQHKKILKMNNAMKQYSHRNSNSNSNCNCNCHCNQKQYKDVNLNNEILNKYTRRENDKVHQMDFNRRHHSESRMKVLNGYNRPHHHDKSRGHSRSRMVLDDNDNDDDNKKNKVKRHPQSLNKNAHTMRNEKKDLVLPPISKSTKDLGVKKKKKKKKRKKIKVKE